MPGTISGSPEPGDGPARDPRVDALVFLVVTAGAGALALAVLAAPLLELVADLLTAAGLPVAGPSSYPRGGWTRVATTHAPAFLAQLVAGQALFGLLAAAGALALGGGVRARLGLVRPRGGWPVLAVAVLLEVLTFAIGIAAAYALLPAGFEAPAEARRLTAMLGAAPLGLWLLLIAAMSILPGICEEALFRGLLQRRLAEGWGPVAAVLATGFVFALLHPPPVRSLILLPGCLWLGYVAWRCGSILPGVVLHAGTNAGFQALVRFLPGDDRVPFAPTALERGVAAAIAIACAAVIAVLVVRVHRWTRPLPA